MTIAKEDSASALMHKEILKSHKLSLKISSMSPEDEGYKETFEELLMDKIDDSVMIFHHFIVIVSKVSFDKTINSISI